LDQKHKEKKSEQKKKSNLPSNQKEKKPNEVKTEIKQNVIISRPGNNRLKQLNAFVKEAFGARFGPRKHKKLTVEEKAERKQFMKQKREEFKQQNPPPPRVSRKRKVAPESKSQPKEKKAKPKQRKQPVQSKEPQPNIPGWQNMSSAIKQGIPSRSPEKENKEQPVKKRKQKERAPTNLTKAQLVHENEVIQDSLQDCDKSYNELNNLYKESTNLMTNVHKTLQASTETNQLLQKERDNKDYLLKECEKDNASHLEEVNDILQDMVEMKDLIKKVSTVVPDLPNSKQKGVQKVLADLSTIAIEVSNGAADIRADIIAS